MAAFFLSFPADFFRESWYNSARQSERRENTIKTLSHRILGKYLAETYLSAVPKRYTKAFLFGCTQPDRNPTTYLKGSFRCQPLRGHHWLSSQNYMQRIARRLQQKRKFKLFDFYTMGKLIHYTADAFTASHNEIFPMDLSTHRAYEIALEDRFLSYIHQHRSPAKRIAGNVMDAIRHYHTSYTNSKDLLAADCHYSVLVTSLVVCMLLSRSAT